MIVTDKFIYIHYPKTGGLFVADVLKRLHRRIKYKKLFINYPLCQELLMPNIKRINGANIYNVHGTYEQIPKEHMGKPIISCIRNPFDRYVSTYEFRNWVKWHSPDYEDDIKKRYPNFPNLTFEQYLQFINIFDIKSRTYNEDLKADIGTMTYTFIQFFFKNHRKIIQCLNEQYINSDEYKNDMADVIFLRTENLHLDLYNVLLKFGYREKDISFILKAKKVNVTPQRKINQFWRSYYNKELYDYVKFKDRFIFRLFPEYDEAFNGRWGK